MRFDTYDRLIPKYWPLLLGNITDIIGKRWEKSFCSMPEIWYTETSELHWPVCIFADNVCGIFCLSQMQIHPFPTVWWWVLPVRLDLRKRVLPHESQHLSHGNASQLTYYICPLFSSFPNCSLRNALLYFTPHNRHDSHVTVIPK